MEEMEDPTEALKETIHEHAEHTRDSLTSRIALSTAVVAVLAAVTTLMAGHHANEAMLLQLKASDQWAYYQAKGIKAAVLNAKIDLLEGMDQTVEPEDLKQQEKYDAQQEEISKEAKAKEEESEAHMQSHMVLARGVTLFQVAISVCAVAALSRKKAFWFLGLLLALGGLVFLILGLAVKTAP